MLRNQPVASDDLSSLTREQHFHENKSAEVIKGLSHKGAVCCPFPQVVHSVG